MKRWLLPVRVLASAGAVGAIVWRIDVGETWSVLRGASAPWVAAAFALNLLAVVLSTALWRTMTSGARPSFGRMCAMYLAGIFHNNVGLGTAVGDAMRIGGLRGRGARTTDAAASVLAERALSLGALLLLASCGAFVLMDEHLALAVAIWSIAALCGALALAFVLAGRRMAVASSLPKPVRAAANATNDAIESLLRDPRRLVTGAGFALMVQLCTVVATFALLRSIGADVSLGHALAVVPVIALFVLLPISVQGIGVRETTYVALFGAVGVAPELALAAALLSYATTLAVSALGGAVVASDALAAVRRRAAGGSDPVRLAA